MSTQRYEPLKLIVALSGWKRSGKDTVAEYLTRDHGFTRISIADILKEQVAEFYDLDMEQLTNQDLKEQPLYQYPIRAADKTSIMFHTYFKDELRSGYWTPRALCILEGASRRAVNPNYWIDQLVTQIVSSGKTKFVVPDIRFPSEINTLSTLPYTLDYFQSPVSIRINRYTNVDTEDPSERALDNHSFDHVILNMGSISDLEHQIDGVIRNYVS